MTHQCLLMEPALRMHWWNINEADLAQEQKISLIMATTHTKVTAQATWFICPYWNWKKETTLDRSQHFHGRMFSDSLLKKSLCFLPDSTRPCLICLLQPNGHKTLPTNQANRQDSHKAWKHLELVWAPDCSSSWATLKCPGWLNTLLNLFGLVMTIRHHAQQSSSEGSPHIDVASHQQWGCSTEWINGKICPTQRPGECTWADFAIRKQDMLKKLTLKRLEPANTSKFEISCRQRCASRMDKDSIGNIACASPPISALASFCSVFNLYIE